MELGVVLPHTGSWATPTFLRDFARTAETVGLDGLWAVDHLLLPRRIGSPYVLGREPVAVADGWLADSLSPNFEMHTTLTWVAAHTRSIALGTAVAVLPLRNAVANARQLATLDVLSDGRLQYGVGVGWMREEVDAMGLPWDRRGARCEEHIALMRALWCADGPWVEFHGEFHDVPEVDPEPRPVQRPIPILIGGHSEIAIRRAARIGDGWITAPMSAERLATLLQVLDRECEAQGRERIRVVAAAGARPDQDRRAIIERFAEIGVDHLQIMLDRAEPAATLDDLAVLADQRIRS